MFKCKTTLKKKLPTERPINSGNTRYISNMYIMAEMNRGWSAKWMLCCEKAEREKERDLFSLNQLFLNTQTILLL